MLSDYIAELEKVRAMYGEIEVVYQTMTHRFPVQPPMIRVKLGPDGKREVPCVLVNP